MNDIRLEFLQNKQFVSDQELNERLSKNKKWLDEALGKVYSERTSHQDDVWGWMDVEEWASDEAVQFVKEKAETIRKEADVFVIVGVGGSNQAARAVIKALQKESKPEILYAGNNLSPHYMNNLLKQLEGKSVYINVIAKNFETLEPGLSFRILRNFLYSKYGNETNKRISVTGTINSSLHQVAKEHNFDFFIFPENIGGRFSALTDVGLLPMAVAGIDISSLIEGAKKMQDLMHNQTDIDNLALKYSTFRNILLDKGYKIEMLAFFEPQFHYFSKWWIQLFAESEGKEGKGLFPVAVNYSEDLHSIGQYVQQGQPIIFETFLDIENPNSSLVIEKDHVEDNFDYVNGENLWEINKIALGATIGAHFNGGIPCVKFSVPEMNEYYLGQLFYLFEFTVYLSGRILGVNPFDQPGVEDYKKLMFEKLGRGF
ncbi:glucose-6-phosphate isomerase [Mesobacillus stamsii]|uniref:Glucose-6-phosphate isomerase n=2 Tax=Mesobacillus subterraneus TaxID=285983 RepID=A0A0D6ZB92_9BACI|nr:MULTISPECIES: glucose-6-phosphate isomerase [Mesobacillus]KIY23109.1 glucose-6-phosphate isomerase [Mesobacillus subterraneus]